MISSRQLEYFRAVARELHFTRAAQTLRIAQPALWTARAMVSVGLAAAILPRSLAESPGPPVRIIELEPELTWTPSLAWSATRRTAPALTAFLDFVVEHPELAGLAGHEHAGQ